MSNEIRPQRVTRIRYNGVPGGEIYNIGTTFANVTLQEDDSYCLQDLYDDLQAFFTSPKAAFETWTDTAPTNPHVKAWFDTGSPNIND